MPAAFALVMLALAGCRKDIPPGGGSSDNGEGGKEEETGQIDDSVMKIVSFTFEKSNNSGLKENVTTSVSSDAVSDGAGVDYCIDPRSLVASFELYAAEDVTDLKLEAGVAGGDVFTQLQSAVTKADYLRPVTLRLSAMRDGKAISRDYSFRFHNLNTGLPVIYIYTSDSQPITIKDVWKEQCRIYLDAAGRKDADGTAFTEDYYGENDAVRGRGNTTWAYAKKPYAVKLEKQASWLGMPKHKRWVLLANAIDRSMMRNRLAYEIGARCEGLEWTPRTRFVELVLNGEHKGIYLCAEQIRSDKDRVPIPGGNDMLDPAKGGNVNADPATMGFLMEIDRYWTGDASRLWWRTQRYSGSGTTTWVNNDMVSWAKNLSYTTNYGSWEADKFNFGLKDPDDEKLITSSSAQFAYIRDFVLKVEKEVLGSSHDMSDIDVDSFIDYWFVFELTMNQEPNNPGSCYMYKKPAADGGKLFAGPVWDFDYGTFNHDFTDGGLYYDKQNRFLCLNSLWYVGLFESSAFRRAVKSRWAALKPGLDMDAYIKANMEYIKKSAAMDRAIWGDDIDTPNTQEKYMSTPEAIDRIYSHFTARVSELDALIASMPD